MLNVTETNMHTSWQNHRLIQKAAKQNH